MTWTAADAENNIKGLSKKQRKKWAAIANGVMNACDDKAKAIHIANAKFQEQFNPVIKAGDLNRIKRFVKLVPVEGTDVFSVEHPDNKKVDMSELFDITEMEIFRPGKHNGIEFTEADLQEMADNFDRLKNEVRPKLKITHSEDQETLAGLASYGDLSKVYTRVKDGSKRLFASIANVPKQVVDFIKNRRFPERSIEIYPKFKLGTDEKSPTYKNVVKAVALLGHEMPAVPGMDPVKLAEQYESQQTVCIGQVCFVCQEDAEKFKEKVEKQKVASASTAERIARLLQNQRRQENFLSQKKGGT